jgi:tetratricopeptide (TPR) repeat protein
VRPASVWPLAALLAATTSISAQVLSPAYRTLVARYAAGERTQAADDLCGWSDSRVKKEVPTAWGELPLRAALMLHTDCVRRAPVDRKLPGPHVNAAWSIARAMAKQPSLRAFARRWYEAFAELAQSEYRWGDALEWAERGLDDFPGSAALWLVRGSIQEMQALQAAQAQANLPHGLGVVDPLQAARKSLRAAIHADPSLAEAHLRLGRVAWRMGDTGEARAELELALARSTEPRTSYLAQLFLGRLEEDAGRFQDAAARYEAAVATGSVYQSGHLALSHARMRLGDRAAARREVELALASTSRKTERDPLWLYPWGPAVGVAERLDAMRQDAEAP